VNEASSGSPEAEAEADGAFEWYRARSEFAAIGFDSALRAAFSSLRGTPRILLDQYPYSVIYRELPRKIQIIAIAHAKRRPGYWTSRI
jgi:plasmid stabilization system protein ParE